jgi:hypothetical protein
VFQSKVRLNNRRQYVRLVVGFYLFLEATMGSAFSIEVTRSKLATVAVAGLLSSAAILAQPAPAQAQFRNFGAGVAAGVIGGMIIGGAMSQHGGPAYAPNGQVLRHTSKSATHKKHKDEEDKDQQKDEETSKAASAKSNDDKTESLAHGVYTTSSAGPSSGQSSSEPPPPAHTSSVSASSDGDVGLVSDKAR